MIDEYSKFKGTLYNVEGGKSGTGVRYEDVAGIEHAMELVEESIEMLLGDSRYRTMGAKPPRVMPAHAHGHLSWLLVCQ